MSVSNNKNSLAPGKNDPSSANQNLRHPIAAAPHQSLPTVRQTQYSIQTQNNHSFQYQQYQQYQQQYQYHPQLSMPTIQYHYHPYTTGGAVHWPQTQYYQQQQQVQVPTIQNFRAGTYQYGLIHQNYHWNAAQHLFSFPHLHQCQQLLAGTMIRPTLPPTLPKPLKVNPDQAVLKNETAIPKIEKVKAEPNTSTRSTLKPEQVSKSTKAYSSSSVAAVYVVRNNKSPHKARKIRLFSNYKVSKLRKGYLNAYKKSGCHSVRFYLRGAEVCNNDATIHSLNLGESDVVIAIENDETL